MRLLAATLAVAAAAPLASDQQAVGLLEPTHQSAKKHGVDTKPTTMSKGALHRRGMLPRSHPAHAKQPAPKPPHVVRPARNTTANAGGHSRSWLAPQGPPSQLAGHSFGGQYFCLVDSSRGQCTHAMSLPSIPPEKLLLPDTSRKYLFYGPSWIRQYAEAVIAAHVAVGDIEPQHAPQEQGLSGKTSGFKLKGGGAIVTVVNKPDLQMEKVTSREPTPACMRTHACKLQRA